MALLTAEEIRARAQQDPGVRIFKRTASMILCKIEEDRDYAFDIEETPDLNYNVFLSSSLDAELVLGVKLTLEDYGYSVDVDWDMDSETARTEVTSEVAATLRSRMDSCKCLLYLTTASQVESKLMTWMCGYMDGKKGRTGILALADADIDAFKVLEYPGIYPYIENAQDKDGQEALWVHQGPATRCTLTAWLNGLEPTMEQTWGPHQ